MSDAGEEHAEVHVEEAVENTQEEQQVQEQDQQAEEAQGELQGEVEVEPVQEGDAVNENEPEDDAGADPTAIESEENADALLGPVDGEDDAPQVEAGAEEGQAEEETGVETEVVAETENPEAEAQNEAEAVEGGFANDDHINNPPTGDAVGEARDVGEAGEDGGEGVPQSQDDNVGTEVAVEAEGSKRDLVLDKVDLNRGLSGVGSEGPPLPFGGEEPVVKDDRLDITFIVLPEGFVHHVYFPPTIPVIYLYNQLQRDLKLDRTNVRITWRERLLEDTDVLNQAVDIPEGSTQVLLNLDFTFSVPAHLSIVNKGENVLRTLQVDVHFGHAGEIPAKRLNVTVVKDFDRKQFLGGFRNKKNGAVYHHVNIQTEAAKKAPKQRATQYSRVTQTAGVTRSQQTHREAFTQMAKPGLEISTENDIYIRPKLYFSAKQLEELRVEKCMKLQAYVRGFFARRLAARLREEEAAKKRAIIEEQHRRRQQHEERKRREIERRTNPRTKADFGLLYNEVEAWRLQETNHIKESKLTKEEQQAALQEVLQKELRLLETIQRLEQKAAVENRKTKIDNTLKAMAAHKTWNHSKPELGYTTVETPFTVRARELMDLYNGLQLRGVTVDERLDILLHVKWTVKEFECPLTREIVELIDREADLLNRARPQARLEALRKRMSNLFLQFIETAEFNPEAINYQRVPLEFTQRPLVKLDSKPR